MRPPTEHPRFRSSAYLGRGGTARVARVFVTDLGREAALKYPLQSGQLSEKTFSELTEREYHLIGDLRFPGLVRLIEPPPASSEYLLLELCEGPSLDQIGRFDDIAVALNVLSSIAITLEFLNASGLVHGDLKPQNIFLPKDWRQYASGELFYSKLSDFSLGRNRTETDDQRLGAGTVGYMAPEIITDNMATHQSDLFALGVTAYQMLSGKHPFMDEDCEPVRVNSRVREEEPAALDQIREDISPDLADLVRSLLAKDPTFRPRSALDLCENLEAFGATYPYRRALRPAHLIRERLDYETNLAAAVSPRPAEKERLDLLCEESVPVLRLVLTTNFIKGNLKYTDGRFRFENAVYWPVRCRRHLIKAFEGLPLNLRKSSVSVAVAGGTSRAEALGLLKTDETLPIAHALYPLLPQLLRSCTVRRLSAKYAMIAEDTNQHQIAVDLFIQAGSLEGAERCAYLAAIELSREHRNEEAVGLLKRVIQYAGLLGNVAFVRSLLMLYGDISKENGEIDEAMTTYQEIVNLYRDLPEDKLLAETYKDLGDLYRIKQDKTSGLSSLEQAMEIYRRLGDNLEESHVLNNMGNLFRHAAEFQPALKKYREALRIQRRMQATTEVASTLNNIGVVYGIRGRYSRCISILNQSLTIQKDLGHAGEIARTLNNLGYAHYATGEMSKAIECLTESLELNRRIGSKKEILFNLENLTSLMTTAGQLKQSLSYFREAISLSRELNDKAHTGVFNANMATVFRRLGRFGETERCLARTERVCQEIDHKLLENNLRLQRAGLRLILGDFEQALELSLQVLRDAEDISDSDGQLGALLIITRLVEDKNFVERTAKLTEELHLKREKRLLDFNQLEFLLEHQRIDQAIEVAHKLKGIPLNLAEGIEVPWMCNLIAECLLEGNDHDTAEVYIRKSLATAQASELLPEIAVALILRGRGYYYRKEWEECYADYRKGLQVCKKMADSLSNTNDRQRFQQKRTVLFLAGEIQRLAKMLAGNRKGAG